jgi:hypothetical protein
MPARIDSQARSYVWASLVDDGAPFLIKRIVIMAIERGGVPPVSTIAAVNSRGGRARHSLASIRDAIPIARDYYNEYLAKVSA